MGTHAKHVLSRYVGVVLALVLLGPVELIAQETFVTFQGRLTTPEGEILDDGTYTLDFFVFDVPVGGEPIGEALNLQGTIVGGEGLVTVPIPVEIGWFDAMPRYLALTIDDVDDDPTGDEFLPRIQFNVVPFAIQALSVPPSTMLTLDTATVSTEMSVGGAIPFTPSATFAVAGDQVGATGVAGVKISAISEGGWSQTYGVIQGGNAGGSTTHDLSLNPAGGRIGIGTTNPTETLDVLGSVRAERIQVPASDATPSAQLIIRRDEEDDGVLQGFKLHIGGGSFGSYPLQLGRDAGTNRVYVPGRIGIQSQEPIKPLHVSGGIHIENAGVDDGGEISYKTGGALQIGEYDGTTFDQHVHIDKDGKFGIGTSNPETRLHVDGTTTTKIIKITGADLAERFPVSEPVKPGQVVVIDPARAGAFKLSDEAYDRRVAGIVSGANALPAGAILGNLEGTEGDPPIALSGRVWCWANTSGGPIEPGDLLTTSSKAGMAMRVTDDDRAQGAVLGKAMTALEDGEGLVLVLVTLQ